MSHTLSLTEAVLFGNIDDVRSQLGEHVDLEAIDEYGFTPLIEAVIANKLEIVNLLLEKGAEVDNVDATGRTALHWAVDNHNTSLCQLLLDHHANPNAYTAHGQPLLVLPLLRQQNDLKQLLYQHHAQLSFAQDFIQVKLLGHRYELSGQADIINPQGTFVAVDYEGFFIEFVLDIIHYSLQRYQTHFAIRPFRDFLPDLTLISQLFKRASALLQYQKYTVDIQTVATEVDPLLNEEWLLLPIAYEGHAISFIKYKHILVRCDRALDNLQEGSIVVYQITRPNQWHLDFVKKLLYQKQNKDFIKQGISVYLGLKPIGQIPIGAQLVGNCSWANIESSILAMLCVLRLAEGLSLEQALKHPSIKIYEHWLQWDKARALEETIQNFQYASPPRKATIAMLLGAVLFQVCDYQNTESLDIAKRLTPILMTDHYQYVLKSYLKVYWYDRKTPQGHHLVRLLEHCGVSITLLR
jgi:hypothetical protein